MADGPVSQFLLHVAPLLREGRQVQAAAVASQKCRTGDLVRMVASDGRAAGPAAQCLSLIGSMADCATLAPLLADERASVREMAEDALWQIWMRAGSTAAVARLGEAIADIGHEHYQPALDRLETLVADEPEFAEAHHQAGIAAHALGRYEDARRYYLAALLRNPVHFAARTALGHIALELGQYAEALRHFRAALEIHPGLSDVRDILPAVQTAARRSVA